MFLFLIFDTTGSKQKRYDDVRRNEERGLALRPVPLKILADYQAFYIPICYARRLSSTLCWERCARLCDKDQVCWLRGVRWRLLVYIEIRRVWYQGNDVWYPFSACLVSGLFCSKTCIPLLLACLLSVSDYTSRRSRLAFFICSRSIDVMFSGHILPYIPTFTSTQRARKIEGDLKGIKRVEFSCPCLIQLALVFSAVKSTATSFIWWRKATREGKQDPRWDEKTKKQYKW